MPSGPFEGARFRVDRQPVLGLWFDAIDSGQWRRFVATGPQQSGKTLGCFVAPTLYHLFEWGETVIWGTYDAAMANDKWRRDLLPAILATRYRELLPQSGEGSRGGTIETGVRFRNGAELRLMTRGGSDKSRAGYTSRVVVITETDGLDEASDASREADPVAQLEGRTRAYGPRARIYMECTVSVREGRTWREYTGGTASRIAMPCPHCGRWVTPDRRHLVGWQEAETELDAIDQARLHCPECAAAWTEQERRQANASAVLIHGAQTVADGQVVGDPPRTTTLGFRWTAANNLIVPISEAAATQWRAARNPNEDAGRREVAQFLWAEPHDPQADASVQTADDIARRQEKIARGLVPDWASYVTVGVDVGKWLLHWVAVAWSADGRGHVIDYGRVDVPSADMAEDVALRATLREFRDRTTEAGWGTMGGGRRRPDVVLIDAGWMPEPVYAVVDESDQARYRASKGFGASQYGSGRYRQPKSGGNVVQVGSGYHVARRVPSGTLVEIDVDQWKTWVAERLRPQVGSPGALSLFHVERAIDHLTFGRHLTAERRVTSFEPRKGTVTTWQRTSGSNHWLDASVLAAVGGHAAGVRVIEATPPPPADRRRRSKPAMAIRHGWQQWKR